jgi:hypothetical protein
MNFTRAHDQYLTPPEEPEAVFCEDCGEEMIEIDSFGGARDMKCVYQFCPGKFEGDAREMAEMLIGATETIKSLAAKVKRLSSTGTTCDECGQTGIQGIRCTNCGARRKA